MSDESPLAVVIGGINGAGKTTSAMKLLADTLRDVPFTNADTIARGLHAFRPDRVAVAAGQVMLKWLRELADRKSDLDLESTLSGRTYQKFLRQLRSRGYRIELYYFTLSSAELAINRVRQRVSLGGHHIPDETVRTRFHRSLTNFWTLYRPIADDWYVYENSGPEPRQIANGKEALVTTPVDPVSWSLFERMVKNDP